MTYVIDSNHKKFKSYIYKNIVENSKFSQKKFQKSRRSTTPTKVQKSLNKIATCLNDIHPDEIPINKLHNVCFIICNIYNKENSSLGVGPLNDSYLMAQMNQKRGYKIFYILDPTREEFLEYLPIFLRYTKNSLVIYYSGRCSNTESAIIFDEGSTTTSNELNEIISEKSNHKVKIVLICDCFAGGSIWDLDFNDKKFPKYPSKVVSIYPIYNSNATNVAKSAQDMHGIFTYHLCRYANENPDISPSNLMDRMNSRLKKFDITICIESTKSSLESHPIFD